MDLNKIYVEEVMGRMSLVFKHAEIEYKFWDNQIKQFGYGHDEGIVLAEYYGQMCAIVNLERELLGAHVLADELESLGEPLFAIMNIPK